MIKLSNFKWWFFGVASFCTVVSSTNCVTAQVTPDNTLPNNSEVKVEGNKSTIEGGTQAGGNLFHSFEKFGVTTGGEAHFNNAADIQNIIGRVTGKSISNIDGLIKANGTANLFLINPNGIVFGENARLDIGGSFFGTSADSMKFADDIEFSAKNPQSEPLLTMNVPVGLQYGVNPGKIQVQGDGQGLREESDPIIDTQAGLRVQPNQTLALVGGDINLEGATLKTAGGRIELGSVKGEGLVNLTPTQKGFSLGYDAVENGGNIELSGQAAVDASGKGAGDIQVWGKGIKLIDGSQIEASTLGSENGGALVVNAQDMQLIGESADGEVLTALGAQVYPGATGMGGDLSIKTSALLIQDGAQVGTNTFATGKGGNLSLNATDVQLIGRSKDGRFGSGLFAGTDPNSTGDAGDLILKTNTLLVQEGGQVSTSTNGKGNAGNLSLNATHVELIGTSKDGQIPSGLVASFEEDATGTAGNLMINTDTLLVKDGAAVSVRNLGKGIAGNIDITANSLRLNNGRIRGDTSSANGGNITLDIADLLLMRRDSQITTTAGIEGAGGDGGNISINTPNGFIIATPEENNDITANAFEGNGGRVKIDANGIFGIIPRSREDLVRLLDTNNPEELNPFELKTNDITAISQQNPNLSGSVEIITPRTDPTSGSIELPTTPVDTEIVDACSTPGYAQSSFTITGTGSLVQSPSEPLAGRLNRTQLATLDEVGEIKPQRRQQRQARKEEPQIKKIVEARGWVRTKDGKIILVPYSPEATSYSRPAVSKSCSYGKG